MAELAIATQNFAKIIPGGSDRAGNSTLEALDQTTDELSRRLHVLRALEGISKLTGNHVQIVPDFSFMPALIGSDNRPIFLYQIVEAIDEYININGIRGDFPTLNHSQIVGSISFLRRVSQLNSKNLDIDDLEDELLNNDPEFLAALTQAYNDKETVRVLSQSE